MIFRIIPTILFFKKETIIMNNSNLSFHSANSAINFKGNNQNFLADSHVSGKEDFNEFTFQLIIIPQDLAIAGKCIV